MLEQNWHPVGEAESTAEAEALNAVRALLPDDPLCHAWTNVVFPDQTGHINEVDLLLLAKQGMFVVELKGWHGRISGRLNDWHTGSRSVLTGMLTNPVNGADKKAKRLAGLLRREQRQDEKANIRLPYVAPAVVMHGRGSVLELSEQTKGQVFGLDGFEVKGVPAFTQLLKRPQRNGVLDKTTCDAVVRLIQKSGLAPRTPRRRHDPADLIASLTATVAVAPASDGGARVRTGPVPIFDELVDEQLLALGVADEFLPLVRGATEVESLIGRVPDEVWDDLEAVAGGESVSDVGERRRLANERFVEVAQAAAATGWIPEQHATRNVEPAPEPEPDGGPQAQAAQEPMSELERLLRGKYGDRVTSDTSRHEPSKSAVRPAAAQEASPPVSPSQDMVVTAEALLAVARTEALAGRIAAAQALHDVVRAALESDNKVDWRLVEVATVGEDLRRFPPVSHRLDQMVLDVRQGQPRAPELTAGPQLHVGSIWNGDQPGPAYSLLVRVPDILDRRSGVFLSQIIGPRAAGLVNARLREGRPDGGRIRIVADGTVLSRRDATSPWFVVGHVCPDEWFPAEVLLAA